MNTVKDTKKVALVMGGTNPHITLINRLKDRGYYTVLIDYYPDPPAKRAADEHIQESTTDKAAVLNIAKRYNAKLIITTNIDSSISTACYVSEKLGLPFPYSYETMKNIADKSRMKRILLGNDIPTAAYCEIETLDEALKSKIPFPVILKPVDSCGSRGVYKCICEEDIINHFKNTKESSRSGKVIIESFIEGDEVSYYFFIQNGKANFITSNQRFRFKKGTEGVIQSTGGIYPALMPMSVSEKMLNIANKIAAAFNLKNTPIFIQAMVSREHEPYVLEFAARIGGGLSFRLIEEENKFDIIDATIDCFLGGEEKELFIYQPTTFSAVMNVYVRESIVGEITGIDQVIAENLAIEFDQYKMKGSSVSGDMSSGSRVGAFFLKGKDADEIYEKIDKINKLIEVYDMDHNRIMYHQIYDFSGR